MHYVRCGFAEFGFDASNSYKEQPAKGQIDPQKLDNMSMQKLFKQPKGLVVCEEQAASPLASP